MESHAAAGAAGTILDALAIAGIDWLLVVPASGLNDVYRHYSERGRCLFATREEEAVAAAAGLALGGRRPLVLMQQSGVGNALNAVLSLADAYGVAFPILVCDRGEHDPNPVQRLSSSGTAAALGPLGCARVEWGEPGASGALARCIAHHRWTVCAIAGKE
jgi:hypothetical protein